MDALSEMLRSFRLTGGVFLDARFTAPWCVLTKLTADHCKPFLTAPAQLIAYHFVISGVVCCSVDDEPAIEVRAGEAVLLPRNDGHILASAGDLEPVNAQDLVHFSADGGLTRIVHGGNGEAAHIICGFLGSDDTFNPLIATLPRMLKIDVRKGASRDWFEASVQFAAAELMEGRPAASGVVSRLCEILFVEAVRDHAATLHDEEEGWLKGAADPHVGRALALIHQKMAEPWSAEGLAREAGLSRSAFIDRFTSLVGVPPIRYLTLWRLQTAKLRLRETRDTIAQLAHAVGYESEEAFSRAFKRAFGLPPARWRDRPVTD